MLGNLPQDQASHALLLEVLGGQYAADAGKISCTCYFFVQVSL